VGLEGVRERRDVLRADGETGGGAVAAEALQPLGAGAERRVEVEGRDRAA
jgi:hypothetical protein